MDHNRKVLIFENNYPLANYLIRKWKELAEESVESSGRFTVALSGGKTPLEFYSRLASLEDFDLWKRTHIFLADERFVPFHDPDSNFRSIKTHLLDYIRIPSENIHPIPTDGENVSWAAEEYKQTLLHFFKLRDNSPPRFDFILLGLGEDGHTASLFPGEKDLDHPLRLTIPASNSHLKHDRVSISLSVINHARHVYFLVLGNQKASILKEILLDQKDVPAAKVNPTEGTLKFLLDKNAAQYLPYKDSYTHCGEAIVI